MNASAPNLPGQASERSVGELIAELGHLLPDQAPLHAFVHHNTLHAFEHLSFADAVVEAARVLDAEPYPSESWFADCLVTGRILPSDIRAVLAAETPAAEIFEGGPSLLEFRASRVQHLFPIPEGAGLRWLLQEGDARHRGFLGDTKGGGAAAPGSLWARFEAQLPPEKPRVPAVRPRDQLIAVGATDPDTWAHPLLIRLAAAFLDQGVAYWSMPAKEAGFLSAFRQFYGSPMGPPTVPLRGMAELVRRHEAEGWDATRVITWALRSMGVAEADWLAVLRATLLSLPGWAGMMRHFEQRPDHAPVAAPPASLLDYVAVQLTLDVFCARHALRRTLGAQATFEELRTHSDAVTAKVRDRSALVYEACEAAYRSGLDPTGFEEPKVARAWLEAVTAFHDVERRRVLHLAYERRHRQLVLDGLAAHTRQGPTALTQSRFAAVFCIDDREESLRRHLEECCPGARTYGYAGFFGVAMEYRGLEDVNARPLCPVVIRPVHLVEEHAVDGAAAREYASRLRDRARLGRALSVGSNTLSRGGVVATVLGVASVASLIGRSVFPRTFERWTRGLDEMAPRPETRLAVERSSDAPTEVHGLKVGFTIPEMADIVSGALRTMALDLTRDRLVMIVGHGSSSLNNPHEAAYNCGAAGGGRGGPNARAFAVMANHPEVRALLAGRGQAIPAEAWFIGAYHNTCDDSMTYYDDDLLPESLEATYATVKAEFRRACKRDAHERCRRFEQASDEMSPTAALARVEMHANDLAQARPEYNHATNAVCIVGRRARTRGLFLDRRAFLVSYDPTDDDDDASILTRLLLSVGPVGAGINLEYYFSFVDQNRYGSGTKLPHNIVGLFGVMDGHSSDLRTGLTSQMVEIHEPVRLLTIVEAEPATLRRMLEHNPALDTLIRSAWIQLIAWSPTTDEFHVFENGKFVPHQVETENIPSVRVSASAYQGQSKNIGCIRIEPALGGAKA